MKGKKKWRLSKTLSRRIDIRPIENSDVKYAYAAYRFGYLDDLGFSRDLSVGEFKTKFEEFILGAVATGGGAWTVSADTPKGGFIPVGFVLGKDMVAFMLISAAFWFPWNSKRNILEGTVLIINRLRKQYPLMFFATEENKKLYETCMMHGIVNRVGTSHSSGQKLTVFEARQNV